MTITVTLTPEVADRLRRQASAQGGDLPGLVRRLAEREAGETGAADGAAEIAVLRRDYAAEDWEEVGAFLEAHPALSGLLSEARPHLSRLFGKDVSARLQIVPEGGDGPDLLFAYVLADDPQITFERMRRLDQEWWLEVSERAGGLLQFDAEFA